MLAEDKLFATLDPTARRLILPDGANALLIDTVGLIRKLPHHLIKAFKSTLEEASSADVLIHVADASSPHINDNISVVEDLLIQLKASDKPIITVYNKIDLVSDRECVPPSVNSVEISAKTGSGVERLLERLCDILPEKRRNVKVLVPYQQGSIVAKLHEIAHINSESHTENGTLLDVVVDSKGYSIVSDYIV